MVERETRTVSRKRGGGGGSRPHPPESKHGRTVEDLSITRVSTSNQVANGLREMIVNAEIPPGTPLREASLAASIGVSRHTIREALRELAREGVVTHHPHRGVVVSEVTEDDVTDIFAVRRVLEFAAIEASAAVGREELGVLGDVVDELSDAARSENWQRIVDADLAFHQRLVRLIGSRRIDAFFQNIQSELRLCLSIVDRSTSDPQSLVAEHEELLGALLKGRRDRCRALLGAHLDDAERLMKSVFARPDSTVDERP